MFWRGGVEMMLSVVWCGMQGGGMRGSVAKLDKASVYGSGDCRFKSCQSRFSSNSIRSYACRSRHDNCSLCILAPPFLWGNVLIGMAHRSTMGRPSLTHRQRPSIHAVIIVAWPVVESPIPPQTWDKHTHSFRFNVFRWLYVVYNFCGPKPLVASLYVNQKCWRLYESTYNISLKP